MATSPKTPSSPSDEFLKRHRERMRRVDVAIERLRSLARPDGRERPAKRARS